MANWAYVENNEVKESYDILPENWKNISNFFALKDDTDYLRTLNWLPISQVSYTYDPTKQKLDNRKFTYKGSYVVEEYDIIDVPEAPKPSIDDIEKMLSDYIQSKLDTFAQTRKYDNILSACSYANDNNVKYRAEGIYCSEIRSKVWSKFSEIMNDIKSGKRPMPNSCIDIENELPTIVWPV